MAWLSFEPAQLAGIALLAGAYAARARRLRRRGTPAPRRKPLIFAGGIAALLAAAISPLNALGEDRLFSAHMAQHLLIGDVAPLLLVLGITGPLVRPILALRVASPLQPLMHPAIAAGLWSANLLTWHVPALYDAALGDPVLHAAQHLCFLAAGVLLWAAVLEPVTWPKRYGPGLRLAGLAAAWAAGGVLANVLLWSDRVYYSAYSAAPTTWGLSRTADQRLGGGVMLLEMSVVMIAAGVWLGLAFFREAERRQRLVDAGAGPEA